jgi:hypothetical protein
MSVASPRKSVKYGDGGLSSFDIALYFHFISPLLRIRVTHTSRLCNPSAELGLAVKKARVVQIGELTEKSVRPADEPARSPAADLTSRLAT